MRHRLPITLAAAALLCGCAFLAPISVDPPLAIGATGAEAAVTKSMSGGAGGGSVGGAGNRLGSLLSGWAVPVLTVLAGCLLVGALASRNIGASFGIVVITLIGLIFLLSPQSIESLAKGIANTVF